MEKITLTNNDNENLELYLIMDTTLSGCEYVLASDKDPEEDDDCECYILKKTGEDGADSVYEMLEEGQEYLAVSVIFTELMNEEGVDLV